MYIIELQAYKKNEENYKTSNKDKILNSLSVKDKN